MFINLCGDCADYIDEIVCGTEISMPHDDRVHFEIEDLLDAGFIFGDTERLDHPAQSCDICNADGVLGFFGNELTLVDEIDDEDARYDADSDRLVALVRMTEIWETQQVFK